MRGLSVDLPGGSTEPGHRARRGRAGAARQRARPQNCDHIQLHRLSRIHARDGMCFDPTTYVGWVEQSRALLDPLVATLGRYASLHPYQLKRSSKSMLADPRRGMAARASLHLGPAVQFVDFRDGQMRHGKIIAMKATQATVLEEGTRRTWELPCLSMQGCTDAERRTEQAPYEPPPKPVATATEAREFQRGGAVTFNDRDGRGITGVVVRINQRTAMIDAG